MARIIDYPPPARALTGEEPLAAWQDGRQIALPAGTVIDRATAAAGMFSSAAQIAAASAGAFVNGIMFVDAATGAAAVAEGAFFTVAGDGTNTFASLYRKVGGTPTPVAQYYSKAGTDLAIAARMAPDASNLTSDGARGITRSVSPNDFLVTTTGASHSDLIDLAIQAAIDHALELDLRYPPSGGAWSITRPIDLSQGVYQNSGTPAFLSPTGVIGGGAVIVVADSVTVPFDVMLRMNRAFRKTIDGLRLFGQGKSRGIIDTSWLDQGAPSQNCTWSNIECLGATGDGGAPIWDATGNNDSLFHMVNLQGNGMPASAVGLLAAGGGGAMRFSFVSSYNAKIQVGCQIADFISCQGSGIEAVGQDYNLLNIVGGYWYASRDLAAFLAIAAGARVTALKVAGAHIEVGIANGRVLTGPGSLVNGATFEDVHIVAPGAVAGVKLLDDSLVSWQGSGIKQQVTLSGTVDSVAATAGATTTLSVRTSATDGVAAAPRSTRILGGSTMVVEDADHMSYALVDPGWGRMLTFKSRVTPPVPPEVGVTVSSAGFPYMGTLFASPTDGNCPGGEFSYNFAKGIIQPRAAYNSPNSSLDMSIDANGNFIISHHQPGETSTYLLAAFGGPSAAE